MAKEKENLKGIDKNELKNRLASLQEDLRMLHFNVQGSKSKNVKEGASIKKQIAKVLTEINKDNKKNK